MLVALHTKYPCQFIRHSRLRASVSSARSLSRSPCVAMNIFGGLFGSKGESKVENTDSNDNVLKWARSAKPETKLAPANAPEGEELATFAGGCFWGIQLAYQRVPGVTSTWVGYTQGQKATPTYEEVCSGVTGHTEAIHLHYKPSEVSYRDLLEVFLERTDPTTKNRQGNDIGTQYRSGIYYHNDDQRKIVEQTLQQVQQQLDAGTYPRRTAGKKIMVEVAEASDFWIAEEYHQRYLEKGGRFGAKQSASKGDSTPIRCYG